MAENETVTLNLGKSQAIMTIVVTLFTIMASIWGAVSWATNYQVEQAVNAAAQRNGYVNSNDLRNFQQLLDSRLGAMERRQGEANERLEFLYRHELERSGKGTGTP